MYTHLVYKTSNTAKPSLITSINLKSYIMYTLATLKAHLGYEALNLNIVHTEEVLDSKGKVIKASEKTEWLRQWDNENRVSVVIHEEALAKIQANPKISSLGIKETKKTGDKGEYTVKTIVVYTEADVIL